MKFSQKGVLGGGGKIKIKLIKFFILVKLMQEFASYTAIVVQTSYRFLQGKKEL